MRELIEHGSYCNESTTIMVVIRIKIISRIFPKKLLKVTLVVGIVGFLTAVLLVGGVIIGVGLIFTPDKSYNAEEKALMAQMEVKLENLLGEDARIVGFREGKLYRGTYVFEYVVDSINYHSTLDSNTELQIWDPRWIYQDVMSKFAEVEFNKILESYFPIKTRLATALFIKEDSWTGQDYKSLLDKRRSELFYDLIIKRDIRLTDKLIEHEINSLFRLMEDLRKQKYVLAEIEMEYKNVSIIFEKNDAMITIYQMKDKYRLALDRLKSSLK